MDGFRFHRSSVALGLCASSFASYEGSNRLSGANGADLAPIGICETKAFIYGGSIQGQGGSMVSVFDVAEYVLSEVG